MSEYLLLISVPPTHAPEIPRLKAMRQPINLWRETRRILNDAELQAAIRDTMIRMIYGPYAPGSAPQYVAEATEEKRLK